MSSTFLSDLLQTVTERGRSILARTEGPAENGAENGVEGLVERCEALISGRGEATGLAVARDILERFSSLDADARLAFFLALAESFGPDRERVRAAIDAWRTDPCDERAADLHFASEPRRQELFRRLNRAPGGMAVLVAMRTAILERLRGHPELASTDRDLHHLLSSWFNRGFLVLRRIDWSTPAVILDKIIRYEAVHEIRDWDDLRRRIDPSDRRCYGFFHPALADEPLIFVEVALTRDIPPAIGPILSTERPAPGAKDANPGDARTAAFYSISNCQKGLRGVSFGNFLIKQVVDELARDLPEVTTFVTLSPAPGFMKWLRGLLKDDPEGLLSPERRRTLERLEISGWDKDPKGSSGLKALLMPLAATYFLRGKNRRGEPADPVARFHLGNGARLERINWLGDTSDKGLSSGAGLMVNYLYDLKTVERNHEAFANHGEIVASGGVSGLMKPLLRSKATVRA